MTSGPPRLLVCAAHAAPPGALVQALERHGYDVTGRLLDAADPDTPAGYRAIVLDGTGQGSAALALINRLRTRLAEQAVAILFITDDHDPATRLASLEAGADGYLLRPFVAGELIARVAALLRVNEVHDRLAEKTAEIHRINKRLQQAYQQIDQELELAQRIQTSFLPQALPQVPHARFAVHHLLCGRVGGDFYDVFRLDERHVGFYVADAMGHGVPASLLTLFVKKGLRPKEIDGSGYRLIPPDEVLYRLNRDLIDQRLAEQPFITLVYALFNPQTGTLRFARAGHPHPLHVPRDGEVTLCRQEGLLLGVTDARFPLATRHLDVGDKVLLYTDGIDNGTFEDQPPGLNSLMACATRHRDLPAPDFVARLARDLFGAANQPDDLTLLALERCD